jgi:colicin import membrane protein
VQTELQELRRRALDAEGISRDAQDKADAAMKHARELTLELRAMALEKRQLGQELIAARQETAQKQKELQYERGRSADAAAEIITLMNSRGKGLAPLSATRDSRDSRDPRDAEERDLRELRQLREREEHALAQVREQLSRAREAAASRPVSRSGGMGDEERAQLTARLRESARRAQELEAELSEARAQAGQWQQRAQAQERELGALRAEARASEQELQALRSSQRGDGQAVASRLERMAQQLAQATRERDESREDLTRERERAETERRQRLRVERELEEARSAAPAFGSAQAARSQAQSETEVKDLREQVKELQR